MASSNNGFDLGYIFGTNASTNVFNQPGTYRYLFNPYYARPVTISKEEQEKTNIQKARRMEAFYRQARLAKQHTLEQEKLENSEDGVLVNSFLLGCDPEFVALKEDGSVLNVMGVLSHEGEVGWDHSGHVIEVRPKPAKGAFALVKRMQRLLKDPKLAKLACSRFRAGAYVRPYALGGHIHLGISPKDLNYAAQITALDAVTKILEHLDILPEKESDARRKAGLGDGYGKFGNVRIKGGNGVVPYHYEYRTMASWLHDPKVAFVCLTAAKLAAVDPKGTVEALKGATSFAAFEKWVNNYRTKDDNALRASRLFEKGHKTLIKDPNTDFRGRWENLGI